MKTYNRGCFLQSLIEKLNSKKHIQLNKFIKKTCINIYIYNPKFLKKFNFISNICLFGIYQKTCMYVEIYRILENFKVIFIHILVKNKIDIRFECIKLNIL